MFLNLGFKSVTMDDLAHEMGISKKTIYSHFDNKTTLVADCTMHVYREICSRIANIKQQQLNPIEELYEIKKFMTAYLNDDNNAPQHQLHKYYPQIYAEIHKKRYQAMKESVLDNLNKGLAAGMYRENLDVDFVSRIYLSGALSIKDPELFPVEQFPRHQLLDNFLEYHLRGIVTPKGREILNHIINSTHL